MINPNNKEISTPNLISVPGIEALNKSMETKAANWEYFKQTYAASNQPSTSFKSIEQIDKLTITREILNLVLSKFTEELAGEIVDLVIKKLEQDNQLNQEIK